MSEQILTFHKDTPDRVVPKDRKVFYDEQFARDENSEPTEGVEIVTVFLVNTQGDVLLQKRSHNKRHNPNLLDKSIGGHIRYGDTPNYTVMVETVQELLTPSIVQNTDEDFAKTLKLLKNYLDTVAVIKHISTDVVTTNKMVDGQVKQILNKTHTYFGVYNGSTRPVDREALGVLSYPMTVLENELANSPADFTNDIVFYMDMYGDRLKEFIKFVQE